MADNQTSDSQDEEQKHETTTHIFIYKSSSQKSPTNKPKKNNRTDIFGWIKIFFSSELMLKWLTFGTAIGILYFTGNLVCQSSEQAKTSEDNFP